MEFNGVEMDLSYLILPSNYVGSWKLYIDVRYKTDARTGELEELRECHMLRAEVEMF